MVDAQAFHCAENDDCESGEKCARAQGHANTCIPVASCFAAIDCDIGQICGNNQCVVPECTSDSACRGNRCDVTSGHCKKGCSNDFECASGAICVDQTCKEDLCASGTASCGRYRCARGNCLTRCSSNDDCATPYVCTAEQCVAPPPAGDAGRDASDAKSDTSGG